MMLNNLAKEEVAEASKARKACEAELKLANSRRDYAIKESNKVQEENDKLKNQYENEVLLKNYFKNRLEYLQYSHTRLFISVCCFILVITITSLTEHAKALYACGEWFVARKNNIIGFFKLIAIAWNNGIDFFQSHGVANALSYIIVGVIALILIVAVLFFILILVAIAYNFHYNIQEQYENNNTKIKKATSIFATITIFWCCLYGYEFIADYMTFNLMSVWIVLSIFATVLINFKEINNCVRHFN